MGRRAGPLSMDYIATQVNILTNHADWQMYVQVLELEAD